MPEKREPGFSIIVYGPAKCGKSYLSDTTPAPRLVLDAEMGSRFTPSKSVIWDPRKEKPPVPDGTWDTAIVPVHDYTTVLKAYEWLNSGQHPFKSVVIDSISEVQQRLADDLTGVNPMQLQDWGTMLRKASALVRQFRDLVEHPVRPIDAVVIIAMMREDNNGGKHPYVQGQLKTTLPYYVDVIAYLGPVHLQDGGFVRRLLIGPTPGYETGERVAGRLGHYIDDADITDMLRKVRGETALQTSEA